MRGLSRRIVLVMLFPFLFFIANSQELLINELMSSNRNIIHDEDGDTPDWIELFNNSGESVNLEEYFLSDKLADPQKWQLPEMTLPTNQTVLIFASGKDRRQDPVFWYSVIDKGDTWKYIVPEKEPASDWKTVGFNDGDWQTGSSGIGYGDSDDATQIPLYSISVFMRKTISVNNLGELESMWLHMDFDDAFVAYLNGQEIARQGIGQKGDRVAFNQHADELHEAQIINGEAPEGYDISEYIGFLKTGENVLSVQVHNYNGYSSDFSAIPIFTLGYQNSNELDSPPSDYVNLSARHSHCNFKLSSSGEIILLSHQNYGILDSLSFGIIPGEYSIGREQSDFQKSGFFTSPTPGQPNGTTVVSEFVKNRVQFSRNEMFINVGGVVELSGAAENEKIRYTLDGSDPHPNSSIYSKAIRLSSNRVVRARIFREGALPGFISSRTYLTDDKPTLPVISVSTDPENLWNKETGIYILGESYDQEMPHWGANYWENWEKPASIEMVASSGDRMFSMNCGIKIFGGWSRMQEQKSLSVFFRNEYGEDQLKNVKLFDSKPIENFKSLVLRNGGNDGEFGKIRDGMMTSLVKELNIDVQGFQPTVMYLNGEYWGIINLREKVNEDYLENNHDVNSDELDLLEWNSSVVEGSDEQYLELIDYINTHDIRDNLIYQELEKKIDISNFIDYQLSEIYFNNRDWPGNNIKYWRPHGENGKWRWILYDTDFGFAIWDRYDYTKNTLAFATALNGPEWPNPPWSTFLLRRLLQNSSFKRQFINRYADVLNTTFHPAFVNQHIDSIAGLIRSEVPRHNQKWGSLWPANWEQSVEQMKNFADYRVDNTRKHFKEFFSLPGHHKVKLTILPSGSGEIELNTLNIKQSGWSGRYFENVPISISAQAYAGYKFHSWRINGLTVLDKTLVTTIKKDTDIRAIYENADDDGNSVVFNEINYNSPEGESAGDWVELYNWGNYDLDISAWTFKDSDDSHAFVLPENTVLKSKKFLVLSNDSNKFIIRHSDIYNYLGEFNFGLSSNGDQLRLFDRFNHIVDELTYGSAEPWPAEANGGGNTLELLRYFYDNTKTDSWKVSEVFLGTPGKENSVSTDAKSLEVENKRQLKVYPNPFLDVVRIQLDNPYEEQMQVSIFSLDGKRICNASVYTDEYTWEGKNNAGQKLNPGIFICKVQSGKEVFTSKIILSE